MEEIAQDRIIKRVCELTGEDQEVVEYVFEALFTALRFYLEESENIRISIINFGNFVRDDEGIEFNESNNIIVRLNPELVTVKKNPHGGVKLKWKTKSSLQEPMS